MKKIWGYIAAVLAGFSAGLISMYKLMGDQIEINIKKVKNKRTSGESNIDIPIDLRSHEISRETKRQQRLNRKKAKQEAKKWKNPG